MEAFYSLKSSHKVEDQVLNEVGQQNMEFTLQNHHIDYGLHIAKLFLCQYLLLVDFQTSVVFHLTKITCKLIL